MAATVLGPRRSQRAALRLLAGVTDLPLVGEVVARSFGHPLPPSPLTNRIGASVPVSVARDAVRALPVQGAGTLVVGPVGPQDVDEVREIVAERRCRIIVRARTSQVAAQLAGDVERVVVEGDPADPGTDLVELTDPRIGTAVAALSDHSVTVLVTPDLLLEAGPGWFQRVAEAATGTTAPERVRNVDRLHPSRWPAWWWGALLGVGMLWVGIVPAVITLGPVLLWYDRDFLRADRAGLDRINDHLVHFLQHDRLTMAGTSIALGVLYIGLAWGGVRQGWRWARTAFLASGCVGFPTLFYYLAFGFVEPLHVTATAVLLPVFWFAVGRAPSSPRWTVRPEGSDAVRRRALLGQLLMVVTGVGLFIGGVTVSAVGLTEVFVPTDLVFLRTGADLLRGANEHLVPFIAHDRAGFGGCLAATAVAITALAAWGWRRGERWVWWTLLLAAHAGFGPAIVVHWAIGYTSFEHLAPVYLGVLLTTVSLTLARPYLCASDDDPPAAGGELPPPAITRASSS